MSNEDYRKHRLYTSTLHLSDVVGIERKQMFSSSSVSLKMTTLRDIFSKNPWIECSSMALMRFVRDGRIVCIGCRGHMSWRNN
jgi:formylmethanofuran dehydrogenase subunit E